MAPLACCAGRVTRFVLVTLFTPRLRSGRFSLSRLFRRERQPCNEKPQHRAAVEEELFCLLFAVGLGLVGTVITTCCACNRNHDDRNRHHWSHALGRADRDGHRCRLDCGLGRLSSGRRASNGSSNRAGNRYGASHHNRARSHNNNTSMCGGRRQNRTYQQAMGSQSSCQCSLEYFFHNECPFRNGRQRYLALLPFPI